MSGPAILLAAVPAAVAPAAPADMALLDRFEALLASHDSATRALAEWCAERHLAPEPRITARLVRGADLAPPPDLARLLGVRRGTRIGYRHVVLSCGSQPLSEAHNWYVPARLTPAMNRALDTSDTPFGLVAMPLGFRREALGRERAVTSCPAGAVANHRARLLLPDGRPLALVVECYTAANLAAGGG
ncbi:MAG: hypothetical protein JSS36_11905 [Proteobacteria bacterium]|nr:hypothetical protein [Pseudomonadota bacterium]